MPDAGDRVYRTRLVPQGFPGNESARNHFSNPDAAREYLEGYVQIRHDADPGQWTRERSAPEKWSMSPEGLNARAVVMGCDVHEDPDALLEMTEEIVEKAEVVGL